MARDMPRLNPPKLRTMARATLGSSVPKGSIRSFMSLGMTAETQGRPVSRRYPPGSVALPGPWNPSPHSQVPEACIVSVSESLTGSRTGDGDTGL